MKKNITKFLIPLSIIAGITLFFIKIFYGNNEATREATSGIITASQTQSSSPREPRARALKASERINELMARVSKKRTPEIQKFLVDCLMKSRDADYQSFFDSWNVDKETRALVLDCVREREMGYKEALKKFGAEGTSWRSNFSADMETEKKIAEFQLERLLGLKNYKAFTELESGMTSAMQRDAKSYMKEKLAD